MKFSRIALVTFLAALVSVSGCSDPDLPFNRISTLTAGETAYLSAPEDAEFVAEDGGEVVDAEFTVDAESTCLVAERGTERYAVVLPSGASVSADGVGVGGAAVNALGTSVAVRGWLTPKPDLEDQWGPIEVCDYSEYLIVEAIN